jgi:polysaccharide deacetylase 2 family uncharacterized protein YibQ
MKLEPNLKGKRETLFITRLYLIFGLLAFVSSLGLDYIAWKKAEQSYVFSLFSRPKRPAVVPVALTNKVLDFLGRAGLATQAVPGGRKEPGILRVSVNLPLDSYIELAPKLEKELRDEGADFQKKEREAEGKVMFSWLVQGEGDERLALLFSCPRVPPEKKEQAREPAVQNRVAIIIDDMGTSLEALQEICDLKRPITISILPLSLYAVETAQMAHDKGLEVMLHLPGESINHQEETDDNGGMIRVGMSDEEIQALVEDFLGRVPYVKGVNNHMGSRITQEEMIMRPILEVLMSKNLYFLDSRTTADTIAYDLARTMGLRAGYRNIFLDSPVGVDFTKQKMTDLCRLAQKTGRAVAIGHPFPETLEALKKNIRLLEKYKVKPVFVSELMQK